MRGILDSRFLCERCGYALAGITACGVCPECGLSVLESHPDQRPGSEFQNAPGLTAWLATLVRVLRRPREVMRRLRATIPHAGVLLFTNLLLASVLMVSPWVGVLVGDPVRALVNSSYEGLATGVAIFVYALGVSGVLFALSRIEYHGVRFFSARRGWRLTHHAAWQVCAHASYGWILSGVCPLLFTLVWRVTTDLVGVRPRGVLDLTRQGLGRADWATVVSGVLLFLGWFCGLLAFEMLVYVGVRECRYANPPDAALGSGPDSPPRAP